MRVVVIGNGIIGLQTAYQIASEDKDVEISIVGDFSHLGCASLAAAAMFNSFCEVDISTFQNEFEIQKWLFNKMSNERWPDLIEQIQEESGVSIASGFGTFLINNTVSDGLEDDNFDAIVAALKRFSEPYSTVRPQEIPHYKPLPTHRATRAIYIDREGWINPRHLFAALKSILQSKPQVAFIDQLCLRLQFDDNVGAIDAAVLNDNSAVYGDSFVLCPGANFTRIVENSHLPIAFQRVFYGVGATLVLETGHNTLSNCIRTPNRGLACGVYSAPHDQSSTIIGASNLISPEPVALARTTSVYTLLKAAMEQINMDFFRAGLASVNLGWRPTSSDTLPMIGRTQIGNLLVATGTKRDGLHCSPIISQYLKDLVLHNKSSLESQFDFRIFRPDRKPVKVWNRTAAIEAAVRHSLNADYQHDFSPAKSNMPKDMENYYRRLFEELHDQVGAVDFGIPPELKDMFRHGHLRPEFYQEAPISV